MDGLTLCVLCDLEQMRNLKIRFCGCGGTDQERLVHDLGVLGKLVCLRIDSHRLDTESMGCAGYATGDFTSVRDHKLLKHLVFAFV